MFLHGTVLRIPMTSASRTDILFYMRYMYTKIFHVYIIDIFRQLERPVSPHELAIVPNNAPATLKNVLEASKCI